MLILSFYLKEINLHDGKLINSKDKKELNSFIKQINKESGLHIHLITNEPKAFGGKKLKFVISQDVLTI